MTLVVSPNVPVNGVAGTPRIRGLDNLLGGVIVPNPVSLLTGVVERDLAGKEEAGMVKRLRAGFEPPREGMEGWLCLCSASCFTWSNPEYTLKGMAVVSAASFCSVIIFSNLFTICGTESADIFLFY